MPPARPRRNWRRIRRWIAAITLIMVIIGAGAWPAWFSFCITILSGSMCCALQMLASVTLLA